MFIRTNAVTTILIVTALSFGGGQGPKRDYSRPNDAPQATSAILPDSAGVSFSQKIDLNEVRFLMRKGNRLFVELSLEEKTLWQGIDGDRIPYGFGGLLPPDMQESVLKKCHDRLRMKFCCYRVADGQSFPARLEAIAGYAEGGAGDAGFVGLLDVRGPGPDASADDLFGDEVIGIAFAAEDVATAICGPLPRLRPGKCRALEPRLRTALGDESYCILAAVRNPSDGAVVAVTRHFRKHSWTKLNADGVETEVRSYEPERELVYLLQNKGTVQVAPFGSGPTPRGFEAHAFTAFPLDVYPGTGDATRIFFLPDLNADGRSELLITAREAFMYDPASAITPSSETASGTMKLIRNFYYGLRE